ncbi:tetratricopeptide repeat protein [Streptosporangium sp. NPDC051022]|uniref:tetratricopeptide repeat protein n=1 Tax=Streptosporangium sp. NPDC051022 TaxID=3155752 RepID=UPI00343A46EE
MASQASQASQASTTPTAPVPGARPPAGLSPLDRRAVLPPGHPGRSAAERDAAALPYAMWSCPPPDHGTLVRFGHEELSVAVDPGRGGRITSIVSRGRELLPGDPGVRLDRRFARGLGTAAGVEWNPSAFTTSPLALEPVFCGWAPGPPDRKILRLWEYERGGGSVFQIDLSPVPGMAALVALVRVRADAGRPPGWSTNMWAAPAPADPPGTVLGRVPGRGPGRVPAGEQVPLGPAGLRFACTVPVTVTSSGAAGSAPTALIRLTPHPERRDGEWSWTEVFTADPGLDPRAVLGHAAAVAAARDTPVAERIGAGSGWGALAARRRDAAGLPRLEPPGAAFPRDGAGEAERRWLHLLDGGGLGVRDRVDPRDPGTAAGPEWETALRRSVTGEPLGDWRVHLRLGEFAFEAGDLDRARSEWEWAMALRPTAWAVRNLALLDTALGRPDQAAVRYLKACRMLPGDLDLATEAVGCLIAAGRAGDCGRVLDVLAAHGMTGRAPYWLLRAGWEAATGGWREYADALARAAGCADAPAYRTWADGLRELYGTMEKEVGHD